MQFDENRSKDNGVIELKEIERYIKLPRPVTLTLSLGGWVMCSAHRLTERNIWVRLNENCPKGSGDME